MHAAKAKKKAMEVFVDAGTNYGVWRKASKMQWKLHQELSSADAHAEGVITFSKAMLDDAQKKGVGGKMVNKRWKRITGQNIEKPIDADTFTEIMSPTKQNQRRDSGSRRESKFVSGLRTKTGLGGLGSPLKGLQTMTSPFKNAMKVSKGPPPNYRTIYPSICPSALFTFPPTHPSTTIPTRPVSNEG